MEHVTNKELAETLLMSLKYGAHHRPDAISEAVRRLREMPEGERIEGCKIVSMQRTQGHSRAVVTIPRDREPNRWMGIRLTLILHTTEESSDE